MKGKYCCQMLLLVVFLNELIVIIIINVESIHMPQPDQIFLPVGVPIENILKNEMKQGC